MVDCSIKIVVIVTFLGLKNIDQNLLMI